MEYQEIKKEKEIEFGRKLGIFLEPNLRFERITDLSKSLLLNEKIKRALESAVQSYVDILEYQIDGIEHFVFSSNNKLIIDSILYYKAQGEDMFIMSENVISDLKTTGRSVIAGLKSDIKEFAIDSDQSFITIEGFIEREEENSHLVNSEKVYRTISFYKMEEEENNAIYIEEAQLVKDNENCLLDVMKGNIILFKEYFEEIYETFKDEEQFRQFINNLEIEEDEYITEEERKTKRILKKAKRSTFNKSLKTISPFN